MHPSRRDEPDLRIGADVALPADVARSIDEFGDAYLDRVFSPRERAESGDDPVRLAARFAGKEAVIKLLRPAPGDPLPLRDVEIVHDAAGAPLARLSGHAAMLAERIGLGPIAVSVTHERDIAFGTAVSRIALARTPHRTSLRLASWLTRLLRRTPTRTGD
jgi:holo-[acyl-carrier protein] synthase